MAAARESMPRDPGLHGKEGARDAGHEHDCSGKATGDQSLDARAKGEEREVALAFSRRFAASSARVGCRCLLVSRY